jgi:GntR family transcriptional regulator, carbon starvation induced regulator
LDSSDKTPITLELMARQRMTEDILSGALAPNARLKIRELTERYRVGSSPVREALSRLVPEGLVTAEGNKGFRVAPLSLRELIEITEMREILEVEAFRRAIARRTDVWESGIISSFHLLSKAIQRYGSELAEHRLEWESHHQDFHRKLIAACGNARLTDAVEALHQHLSRYRTIFMLTEMSAQKLLFIHEELMQVALDGDVEAAGPIMRRHVKINVDLVRAGIGDNPALRDVIDDS